MAGFRDAHPRRSLMLGLAAWTSEAAFTDWDQGSAAPPGWAEAHRRLLGRGHWPGLARAAPSRRARRPAPSRPRTGFHLKPPPRDGNL